MADGSVQARTACAVSLHRKTAENQMTQRAENKARTRRRVLDAARKLFERDGYEATTIRGIADEMAMSTGAIFAQFTGKQAVYEAVFGHAPETPEAGRRLIAAVRGLLPYAEASVGRPRSAWPSDSVILEAEATLDAVAPARVEVVGDER